ncbi:hypothetical protein ANN_14602 [Periplaneta americana]|uniref:Uncharacterized protein n=1 Tax=Periplaneta americana TaxID=6978 RepID=A0ABQ8SWS6_PERAM|nr:hypothetical protein ANN_14602 [Periplaneta americana]
MIIKYESPDRNEDVTGGVVPHPEGRASHRKLPSICSNWVEGKPREKPQPGNLPQPGFEPGPPGFAARRAKRYSTGVDYIYLNSQKVFKVSAIALTTQFHSSDQGPSDIMCDNLPAAAVALGLSLCVTGSDIPKPSGQNPTSNNMAPITRKLDQEMMGEVYKRKVETREELLARILHACAQVKECPNQLRSATQQLSTRAAKCIEIDGGLFEHVCKENYTIEQNIRRLRWAGHVARMGESKSAYIVLVGKKGERLLGRPRCRWEDNIKMDLKEMGYDSRDWINLAQYRDRWRGLYEGGYEPPGVTVTYDGRNHVEMKERLKKGKYAISTLNQVLWDKKIRIETKHTIYKSIVRSTTLYGAETWQLQNAFKNKFLALEMDYWRRSAGISKRGKIRNDIIREKMQVKNDVVEDIFTKQLIWYGHRPKMRMNTERLPRLVCDWTHQEEENEEDL